ncbi:hypothetical protein, partial [Helicobacter rodentium]|uniref:hypothetical protein n=1 Tax=Helicobacter rodentium TaxID=59617 RepID=UPI000554E6BD
KAFLAMTKSKPLRHCERSEAIHNQAYINFCNGIFKEVQYYRFALKRVSCLTQHTPRLPTKSRNDKKLIAFSLHDFTFQIPHCLFKNIY